jgi:hypothetical protein
VTATVNFIFRIVPATCVIWPDSYSVPEWTLSYTIRTKEVLLEDVPPAKFGSNPIESNDLEKATKINVFCDLIVILGPRYVRVRG